MEFPSEGRVKQTTITISLFKYRTVMKEKKGTKRLAFNLKGISRSIHSIHLMAREFRDGVAIGVTEW